MNIREFVEKARDYFSNVYRNKQLQFIKDLQSGLSIEEALNNI